MGAQSKRKGPRLPALFGGHGRTEFLVTLAKAARIRRVQLLEYFSDGIIKSRSRLHPALLTIKWPSTGGQILALNPWFPFAHEVRELLLAIGNSYTVLPICDVTKDKWNIPDGVKCALPHLPRVEFLFNSPIRTLTLLTLEILGGRCAEHLLHRCVPGESNNSIRGVVLHFAGEGILKREGGVVAFADVAWMPKLRELLRVYGRHDPSSISKITELLQEGEGERPLAIPFDLMGTSSTQRMLVELARNGPMRYARLLAAVKSKSNDGLVSLESAGIIVTRRNGTARTCSLNAAYPVHAELRDLLRSIGKVSEKRIMSDLAGPPRAFEADCLFGREMRSVALLAVSACGENGLDASTMARLFPEYTKDKLGPCLRRLETLGVVERRRVKTISYFRLAHAFPHHASLLRLLNAINRIWPHYAMRSVAVRNDIQPMRRRAMDRETPGANSRRRAER